MLHKMNEKKNVISKILLEEKKQNNYNWDEM